MICHAAEPKIGAYSAWITISDNGLLAPELGDAEKADLEVRWTSGLVQRARRGREPGSRSRKARGWG
jgi:hypothetical protein